MREGTRNHTAASGDGARARAAFGWAVKALALLAIGGADCRSRGVRVMSQIGLSDGATPAVGVRVAGQGEAALPGGAVARSLFVSCPKPGGPDEVTVRWTPPQGATGITFPTLQPVNPLGPAPYEFAAITVTDSGDPAAAPSLEVAYAAPAPPQPAGGAEFFDCFTAVLADGSEYSASFADAVTGAPAAAAGAANPGGPGGGDPDAAPGVAGTGADAYRWWQADLSLQPPANVPLSQALCQEWAAFLQDPAFFVAIRVPMQADGSDPRSAPLPLVVPEPLAPAAARIELLATEGLPATAVFGAALELRPERLGLAAAVLPAAAGERWMTLGVSSEPPATCPEGLAGGWDLHAVLALDLGGAEDSCRECVLEQYLCYEGGEPPFFFAEAANAGVGALTAGTVQRSGVTCAGPIPLRLAGTPPQPPITLEGTELRRANSNALVKLAHTLHAWLADEEETDVALAVSSSSGFQWGLYKDSALQHPIDGPVTISGSAQFDFWASTRLPFGFRGPESITVTASPAEPLAGSARTTDHLWVGAWTPPPPAVALDVESPSLSAGAPVRVSGALPDGSYRLVVVPNGAWVPGECYVGEALAAVDVTVNESALPPTVVWPAATAGSFDVLALSGACPAAAGPGGGLQAMAEGDVRIVACMDCSLGVGVEVTPSGPPLRRRLRRRP